MLTTTSYSLGETKDFAKNVLDSLADISFQGAKVVLLKGNLGAGKTAFAKSVAEILGVQDEVTSPTFVIQKRYEVGHSDFAKILSVKHLIHIDAYRLQKGDELLKLKFKETLEDKNNLILLEWPEMVEDILPNNLPTIEFEFVDEFTRSITYYSKADMQL